MKKLPVDGLITTIHTVAARYVDTPALKAVLAEEGIPVVIAAKATERLAGSPAKGLSERTLEGLLTCVSGGNFADTTGTPTDIEGVRRALRAGQMTERDYKIFDVRLFGVSRAA
ncbi:hypothetical protein [Streptosporangium roseum]|uniref:hypothetical protein n=1 Tax=Streptosporangium roseum TaxID=2001 RepID=UPI0012DFCCF7|nr:hypothetical protein [Streptosporangium roseum]